MVQAYGYILAQGPRISNGTMVNNFFGYMTETLPVHIGLLYPQNATMTSQDKLLLERGRPFSIMHRYREAEVSPI